MFREQSNYPAWSLCFETIKCKAAHTFSPLSSFTMSASSSTLHLVTKLWSKKIAAPFETFSRPSLRLWKAWPLVAQRLSRWNQLSIRIPSARMSWAKSCRSITWNNWNFKDVLPSRPAWLSWCDLVVHSQGCMMFERVHLLQVLSFIVAYLMQLCRTADFSWLFLQNSHRLPIPLPFRVAPGLPGSDCGLKANITATHSDHRLLHLLNTLARMSEKTTGTFAQRCPEDVASKKDSKTSQNEFWN